MSTITPISEFEAISGSREVNAYSRALSDEANANHELKRFRVEIERIRSLARVVSELDGKERVNEAFLEGVEKETKAMLVFFRQEFADDSNGGPPRPLMETLGNLRLAAFRLETALKSLQSKDNSLDKAINELSSAWNVASYIDGLSNWPTFLREVRKQKQETADLLKSVPELKELYNTLEVEWVQRISDGLHGEMLLMASYQTPALANLADVLIRDDIRPALERVRNHAYGKWTNGSTREQKSIPISSVSKRLVNLSREIDAVEKLGVKWVERTESYVELLKPKTSGLDLSERFVIDRTDVSTNKEIKTAVFVVPHADDEASKLGALASQLHSDGWRTVLIVMTENSAGAPQDPIADTPALRRNFPDIRRAELLAASKELGFQEVVVMGYGDSGMKSDPSSHRARLKDQNFEVISNTLASVIGEYSPHAIFTIQDADRQFPYEHPDHEATERIARQAAKILRDLPDQSVKPTYYVNTLAPQGVQQRYDELGLGELVGEMPHMEAPVTTAIKLSPHALDGERRAHDAYSSQITSHPHALWRRTHPTTSYLERIFPAATADEPLETSLMAGEKTGKMTQAIVPSASVSTQQSFGVDSSSVGLSMGLSISA